MRIVWFRRDLRLDDCEIVAAATQGNKEVLPCFVIDPWFYQQFGRAKLRIKFLFESLENLDKNLRQRGSKLYLLEGNSLEIIKSLTQNLLDLGKKPQLYLSKDVQLNYGIKRDRQIINFYQQQNLKIYLGLNHFLQDSDNAWGTFWQDYHRYQNQSLHPTPVQINTPPICLNLPQLTIGELKQKYGYVANSVSKQAAALAHFAGGEDNAKSTLRSFLERRYEGYHWKISYPWLTQQGATSHLSPHLNFGTISARTAYQQTTKQMARLTSEPKKIEPKKIFALKAFLDRLRWHDKFSQGHYFNPKLTFSNPYPEFAGWYADGTLKGVKAELFQAWCTGRTGFPLIDASMRQLNQMGWMCFRMRAMCVTFLTINCGVSWQHGARYFMNQLIDGDVAINHRQWQNQAGISNPMSKSFRIYNPTKNLQEKDKHLKFVRYWIPELQGHSMEQLLAQTYLPQTKYPQPILDLKQTRLTNGKIIADLRATVRNRLGKEQGAEYIQAVEAKETIENYLIVKDQQYRSMKSAQTDMNSP